jgi:hypothetical protein
MWLSVYVGIVRVRTLKLRTCALSSQPIRVWTRSSICAVLKLHTCIGLVHGCVALYKEQYSNSRRGRTQEQIFLTEDFSCAKMDNEWDMHTSWIWHPDYDDTQNPGSIVLFRREFHLTEVPQSLTITVTADTRYRLFVNGQSVSVGPCKGTPSHWYYETVDASGLLRPGPNVIASSVLRYSPMHRGNTPVTRSRIPGFILLAQGGKV